MLACDVQRGFMQARSRMATGFLDYSARCRRGSGARRAIATISVPLKRNRLAVVIGDASGKRSASPHHGIANVQSLSSDGGALFTGDDLAALLCLGW